MAAQEIPLLGYRPKLLKRVEVAEGTMSFHFEKPSGFDYKPGQSSDLTLLDPLRSKNSDVLKRREFLSLLGCIANASTSPCRVKFGLPPLSR